MEIFGSYSPFLVVVSVATAMLSSFVALATVPRIFSTSLRSLNLLWSLAFGMSMGAGVWTMHFIAMLAFHLPVPVHYDATLTGLSLLLAMSVSSLAILPLRSGGEITVPKSIVIGVVMGAGIAGMHYTGMAAMRMNATMQYDSAIVGLSIVIAMVASAAALLIANHLRDTKVFSQVAVKSFAAVIMGLAVSSMHYTAMVGMKYHLLSPPRDLSGFVDPHFLTAVVVVMAFLIQGGVLITALLDEAYASAKLAEQSMRRRADMNRALSEILSSALEGHSLQATLEKVLGIVLDVEWLSLLKKGSVFIADPKRSSLNMIAEVNLGEELLERCNKLAFGECLCGMAAANREVVFRNCVDDSHTIRPEKMQPHGHYCFPFPSHGEPLGVINLYVEHGHQQRENETEFLAAVADAVASIVRQSQLESQADKIFKAIDQAGEAVLISDKNGVIEYVNQAFTKITGYPEDEALGQKPSILKSGNQSREFYEKMWATITSGQVWQGEVIEKRKDGSFYPAMLTISPIRNGDGEITHYVGIHEDLSEHKSLEQQFRQAQKMEALGTLVGGIAHDFNNMLAGMIGNLFLVKKKMQAMPDVLEKINRVEKVGFQAADMIKQMMVFARNDDVRLEEMPLTSFVKETFKLHQAGVPESIDVVEHLTSKELMIKGNPTQLQQVLLNLFGNAVHALEGIEAPRIDVTLDEVEMDGLFYLRHPKAVRGTYAHITIADNGHGISAEAIENVFDPFFTTKEVGKGTGLGLAMSSTIIKSHGGHIEAESEPGRGAEFHIYIPLVKAVGRYDELSSVEEVSGGTESIMVVDDDEGVRSAVSEALESLGYSVVFACNGREAVDMFKCGSIDLVVLDIVMPTLGGVAAAREILSIDPEAKIIFATGYDRGAVAGLDKDLELIPLLDKPFQVSELNQTIRLLLD